MRGQQGERLEHRLGVARDVRSDGEPVGEEHRVEPAALGDPGQLDVVRDVERAGRVDARVAPGRLVVADAHEEGVEVQGASGHGGSRSGGRAPAREAALGEQEDGVDGQADERRS